MIEYKEVEKVVKVSEAIEYIEKLEKARINFAKAQGCIGSNNMVNNLTKDDCQLSMRLIEEEINRIDNAEVIIK